MTHLEDYLGLMHCRADRRPFAPPDTEPQYPPDRTVDVVHLHLALRVYPETRSIDGVATHTLRALRDQVKTVGFHSRELTIRSVRFSAGNDSRPCLFEQEDDDHLLVTLPESVKMDQTFTISVSYSGSPRKGLYFFAPSKEYPHHRVEVYSQGEDQDNRWWIPCHDFPNDRFTFEMLVTVPKGMTAISNGLLVSRKENKARRTVTFHWKESVSLVSYLICLCVSDYEEVKDDYDGKPVLYYVPRGRRKDTRRSFGNTPAMLRFFSEKIGVEYPYEKYAQTCVQEFFFGGMENTSATTQTERTLHDERAHLDFSSDPLVAHELAHQWWGDLLTCKDWSHAWLNEGFATYFEALWTEHHKGTDEFLYEMYLNARLYQEEDTTAYRRPIVTRTYEYPFSLFDRHLYEKGSCVLHMIRGLLGETLWWRAIHHYCVSNREKVVETQDFIRSICETSGMDLQWFFDQWVYKPGHPAFKVSWSVDRDASVGTLTVTQTQSTDDGTPIFRVPLEVTLYPEKGNPETHRLEIKNKEHRFHIPVRANPKWVAFDSGQWVLKTLDLQFPVAMLRAQLECDPNVVGRCYAATALAKNGSSEAIAALKDALIKQPFWGVQASCAEALGKIRGSAARDALLDGLEKVMHPKARRSIVRALGLFRDNAVFEALASLVKRGDPSYFVESEACISLGKTKNPRAREYLLDALKRDSWNEVIRIGALAGLRYLEDESDMTTIAKFTKPPHSSILKSAALSLLAEWGAVQHRQIRARVAQHLLPSLDDPIIRVRLSGVLSFAALADGRFSEHLSAFAYREVHDAVKHAATRALSELKASGERPMQVARLQEDLEALRKTVDVLKDSLGKLEARLARKRDQKRSKKMPSPGRKTSRNP
ncbi:MAG: M1 family aminopeptidase [bacterium JZ-2024 1]